MHGENDNRNNNGIDIGKTAVAIEYEPGAGQRRDGERGTGVSRKKSKF